MTVPEAANCRHSAVLNERKNCCVMEPYLARIQVDQAYAAAVKAYGFSRQPSAFDLEAEAYPDLDRGHVHEAEQGTRYRMSGIVVPRGNAALFRGLWLELTLISDAEQRTEVRPAYCQFGGRAMADQASWHREVQESLHEAVPPMETSR